MRLTSLLLTAALFLGAAPGTGADTDNDRGGNLLVNGSFEEGPDAEFPDPDQPTPSEDAARRERAEALGRAMTRLPEDQRTALVLRFQERLPFEEVGRRLGRSADAARKLVVRAIKDLKDDLRGLL